jgi:serine protease AprX
VSNGTLAQEKAANLVGTTGYIELSGTSFAAPVISGIAAQILARFPHYTPDQVKGAMLRGARTVPQAAPLSCGVGQVNAVQTVLGKQSTLSNPNLGLNRFLKPAADGTLTFDAVSWSDAVRGDVSWDAVSWADVSWADVSWDAVSWADVSWADVSWADVSWADVSYEDNAEGDGALPTDGYEATAPEVADAAADPDLLTPEEREKLLSSTSSLIP